VDGAFEYEPLTVTVEGTDGIEVSVEPTATHRSRPQNPSIVD